MTKMSWMLCVCLAIVFTTQVSRANQADVDARRKALTDLLAEQWEYTMRTSPVWASMLGDKRWNDKLEDFSQQAIDKDLEVTKKSDAVRSNRHGGLSYARGSEQEADGA